jgi:GDP-L-fucose synthase
MKVLIFGSNGLVGKSCEKVFSTSNKATDIFCSTRNDTNLFDFIETKKTINKFKPDLIINAAAKVGGILANNTLRVDFLLENLKININILESVIDKPEIKLINLGSSCIYPLDAKNPIKEEYFMTGKLEPTNSPYALAKISAIELGDAISKQYGNQVINLMPTNLYGPYDNFSEDSSHVIPGLIRRMHKSKYENKEKFEIWGTGKPLREFLYAEDLAKCIEYLCDRDLEHSLINVGSGKEISIYDLALLIQEVVGYEGELSFDSSKPDGNPRKLLDSTRINSYGWSATTSLELGLETTYNWFLENKNKNIKL